MNIAKVTHRLHRVAPVAIFVSALLLASHAGAQQTFLMNGAFARSTGAFVDIPAVGNVACPSIVQGQGFGTNPAANMLPQPTTVGTAGPAWMTVLANGNGCVPGGGSGANGLVNLTGSGSKPGFTFPGGTFTSKPFFSQPFPSVPNRVTVMNQPQIISLSSIFQLTGPSPVPNPLEPFLPTMANGTNTANWRAFRAGAWTTQTGRAGKNFTFCYGNPACTAVNQGTRPIIVKYQGGAGQGFGGTMGIILQTHPVIQSRLAVLIPQLPPGAIGFNPIGNLGAINSQAPGRGYAVFDTDMLLSGPAYLMYTLTGGGLVGMASTFIGNVIPAGYNNNFGFPWTTGTVLARNTGTAQGNPFVQTLTAMGSDGRTGMGTGNIQLVAGSVTANTLGSNTPGLAQMRLTFIPEPGAMLQLSSAVLALLGIAAWRSRKA